MPKGTHGSLFLALVSTGHPIKNGKTPNKLNFPKLESLPRRISPSDTLSHRGAGRCVAIMPLLRQFHYPQEYGVAVESLAESVSLLDFGGKSIGVDKPFSPLGVRHIHPAFLH